MNAVDTKLNYFKSKLDQVRRLGMDYKMAEGQYDAEFKEWMKEQGVAGENTLIDLIQHFRQKPKSDLIA